MVKLSRLKREDVPRMMAWGKHTDPRFFHYNFDVIKYQPEWMGRTGGAETCHRPGGR